MKSYTLRSDTFTLKFNVLFSVSRVSDPVNAALKAAGLEMSDIDGVEILGGGVRVPRVKEELHKIFGDMEVRETRERERERESCAIYTICSVAKICSTPRNEHLHLAETRHHYTIPP